MWVDLVYASQRAASHDGAFDSVCARRSVGSNGRRRLSVGRSVFAVVIVILNHINILTKYLWCRCALYVQPDLQAGRGRSHTSITAVRYDAHLMDMTHSSAVQDAQRTSRLTGNSRAKFAVSSHAIDTQHCCRRQAGSLQDSTRPRPCRPHAVHHTREPR